jgi:hypothetical protein
MCENLKKRKKMVNVTIDGCAKTSAGGTASEWFTLIATIAAAVLLTMSKFFKQDRNAIMGWLLGVLVLSMLLGALQRSCKDKIEEADKLTAPDVDKPTCVKTHTGLTSFQLTYVALAAVACLFLRGHNVYARILAVTFGGIALISWVIGLLFPQRCGAKIS